MLKQIILNYDEDIVCVTTDGASVKQKVGRLSNCDQQLCIVPGIQLGVQNVLYKKPSTSVNKSLKGICSDGSSSENNDDDDKDMTTDNNANITNDDEEDFPAGFNGHTLQRRKMHKMKKSVI